MDAEQDAEGKAYIEWLERTWSTPEQNEDQTHSVMPVPMVGHFWMLNMHTKEYFRGYMYGVVGIGLTIVGIYGLSLAWNALCWFVNGGIRGVW